MAQPTLRDRIHDVLGTGARSSTELAEAVGVSRQAVHHHLRRMVETGEVRHLGAERGRTSRYELAHAMCRLFRLDGLEEDRAWSEIAERPEIADLPTNAVDLHRYVFTEMMNNAIEHSEGSTALVTLRIEPAATSLIVADDGVGVFAKIGALTGLASPPEAIAELSKGKLTTDPEHHTGEGIFFSSRAVDRYVLESNGWGWRVDNTADDWTVIESRVTEGTSVRWSIADVSSTRLTDIFDRYTEDLRFARTATRVALFDHGTRLISRSEARRLTSRLGSFTEVELDFGGVEHIGQGFADELFRVWAGRHPDVTLRSVNMNPAVEFMVRRAKRG